MMKVSKNTVSFLVLFLIGFVPLLGFFHPGLPFTHDGQDHVARIANFYQNLREGNIIPRWAPNLNWGYGHPILMFLYPLPSYVASLFHFIGFSLVDSVKIVFGLGFVASGLAMYTWLKEFLGKKSAFVGSILYIFAPYRFVDLYVRGAIGEHVAFIFPPLILYFLLKISKKIKFTYIVGGSFSLAGLILSHNAITLMFLPVIFLYALYLLAISKESFGHLRGVGSLLGRFGILGILGFCLSSFFWIPAFFEGKYTLRNIVTSGEYSLRFVNDFSKFLYGEWSYGITGFFSVQIGAIQWLLIVISIPITYIFFKKRNNLWIFYLGSLVIFFFSLFLMTPYSKIIWENITVLQKFQFPWRFLSVSVFASAFLGAFVVDFLSKRLKIIGIVVLVFLILFFNKDYWHAKDYLLKPESFFSGVYHGTTDTGESAPIWSVRFMLEKPKAPMEVIDGEAIIDQLERSSTSHSYFVDAGSRVRLRENTLYFPGWNIYVDGKKKDIEFQDPANRGLMTFYVDKGMHDVQVKFKETKLRMFANVVSGVSILIVIGMLLYSSKIVFKNIRI